MSMVVLLALPLGLALALAVVLGRAGTGVSPAAEGWAASPTAATAPTVAPPGRPSRLSVARALGRVEARELLTGPVFAVGLGLCALSLVLFGFVFAEGTETWSFMARLSPWLVHPLAGMTVLAGHRAVTRARRHGAEELLDTCPTAPEVRTAGFLFAGAVPVVAAALFLGLLALALRVNTPLIYGIGGPDAALDVAAALLLPAGAMALGVALGRWVPFVLAPVVAVVAVGFAMLRLNMVGEASAHPLTPLSTAPIASDVSRVFLDRPAGWHLAWVMALTSLMAVIALARHQRGRSLVVSVTAVAALVLVAGVGATRSMSDSSAARIASRIADPAAHQTCRAAGRAIQACTYPFHEPLLDITVERLVPINAVLPAEVGPIVVRQSFEGSLRDLPPAVRRHLGAGDLDRPVEEVPLGFGARSIVGPGDVGFLTAFAAMGLPVEPDEDLRPAVVAGQSRGVVAIWLATRGLDPDDAARASRAAAPASSDPFASGSIELVDDPCVAPVVVWSAQDLAAARAVMALPEAEVRRVVSDQWDRWSNPRTTTDELLTTLGLPSAGIPDQVRARPGNSC